MKKYGLFLVILLVCNIQSLWAQDGKAMRRDEKAVLETFRKYQEAVLADRGSVAWVYVDERTRSYYDRMVEIIRSADSATVSALPLLDRITVLFSRYRVPLDTLKRMDGKSMFTYAIRNGMIGKGSVAEMSIGKVEIQGDFAAGQMVSGGEDTPINFHFYRESENEKEPWKLDLTSIFRVSEVGLQQMIASEGISENEYLLGLMQSVPGLITLSEIWQPLDRP